MQSLQRNDETGFLETQKTIANPKYQAFDSDKKTLFLSVANECLSRGKAPKLHELCDVVGVDIRTFERHLLLDSRFNSEWTEVKKRLASLLAGNLYDKAESKNGIVAVLAYLKYLESGSWFGEKNGQTISDMSSDKKLEAAKKVYLDAEIVDELPKSGQ